MCAALVPSAGSSRHLCLAYLKALARAFRLARDARIGALFATADILRNASGHPATCAELSTAADAAQRALERELLVGVMRGALSINERPRIARACAVEAPARVIAIIGAELGAAVGATPSRLARTSKPAESGRQRRSQSAADGRRPTGGHATAVRPAACGAASVPIARRAKPRRRTLALAAICVAHAVAAALDAALGSALAVAAVR